MLQVCDVHLATAVELQRREDKVDAFFKTVSAGPPGKNLDATQSLKAAGGSDDAADGGAISRFQDHSQSGATRKNGGVSLPGSYA